MVDKQTVRIPSGEVPAVPTFDVDVADGWVAVAAPGAVARLSDERHPSRSITVTSLRVDDETGLRDVAVRSFARQRQAHPSAEIRAQRTGRFGDRLVYLREVAIGGTTPVAQLQAMFLVESGPARDAFSFVGTAPVGELDEFGPVFVDVVASFREADPA